MASDDQSKKLNDLYKTVYTDQIEKRLGDEFFEIFWDIELHFSKAKLKRAKATNEAFKFKGFRKHDRINAVMETQSKLIKKLYK